MNFTFAGILSTINTRLALLNDFKNVLFHSTYQRIADLIAYISEKTAYLAEYYFREASWKNALNRSSLLNQSDLLGYTPHRKTGAGGALYISGDPTFSTTYVYPGEAVFIAKYTRFTDTTKSQFVYAVADTTYYKGTTGSLSLSVKQGIPKVFTYTATGVDNEKITIFNDSTDNDTLEINIVDTNGNVLYPVTIVTEPYFINNLTNYYVTVENEPDFSAINIYSGNNSYTRTFIAGQLVQIKYIETLGDAGNIEGVNVINTSMTTLLDANGNAATLYITNPASISDGRGYETLESIRNNGRRLTFAGYRLASNNDWVTLLNSTPYIQKSKVWTKADLGLPATGLDQNIVYISSVSNSGDALTAAEQSDVIYNYLIPKKCPTDVISFQPLQKIFVKFDCDVTANKIPVAQIKSEINTELNVYKVASMDFAQNIYFSNYTKQIDLAADVKHHASTAWYVEKTDNTGALFSLFKYTYTLQPTKSGDAYYPVTSQYYEANPNNQILLVSTDFEIWIKRKVTNVWYPPVKVARATTTNIKGLRYIALNDIVSMTRNPGATDDNTLGYYVGKIWKNTAANTYWACLTNGTGTATWQNIQATSVGAPTVNSDGTLGFTVGSVWYDPSTGNYWQCNSNGTGAALWQVRNNVSGFGNGSTDFEPNYRSFTWSITGDAISYTTNVISYELRTIIDNTSAYGVLNPSTTDPNGFLIFLAYRMQDGNGLQNQDIRLGGFAQILDFDSDLNTFSIEY